MLRTQVVYPALDSKVRNVTSAYSREHEDEVRALGPAACPALPWTVRLTDSTTQEHLFEELSKLLAAAILETGKDQMATVRCILRLRKCAAWHEAVPRLRPLPCRQIVCKVEEVHTTLRKHLAKEEEQLFPLLLQHFTHAEQARTCPE